MQGDADARVRAIATEVFGLRLVGWDRDSNDWCTNPGAPAVSCAQKGVTDQAGLERELRGWATGSKSPGPIGLQHENGPHPVNAFINTYPVFVQNGWNAMCAILASWTLRCVCSYPLLVQGCSRPVRRTLVPQRRTQRLDHRHVRRNRRRTQRRTLAFRFDLGGFFRYQRVQHGYLDPRLVELE